MYSGQSPQQTMLPNSVELNAGRRQNLINQATANARGNALQAARVTNDYQQGSASLDDIRNEYQANAAGITPAEANMRRQKMFADPRYQVASQQVGQALQPITMAGANAGNDMRQALAGVQYLTPGFFEQRQADLDANTRANAMGQAQVGGLNAATDAVKFQTEAAGKMLPGALTAQGIQNAQGAIQTMYMPQQLQGQVAGQAAQTAQTQANTNRIQEKSDAPTMAAAAKAQGDAKTVAAQNKATAAGAENSQYKEQIAQLQAQIKEMHQLLKDNNVTYVKGAAGPTTQPSPSPAPQQGQNVGAQGETINPDGTRTHNGRTYKMVNGVWTAVQ